MPEHAVVLQRFVSQSWPGAAAFFERAEPELARPDGLGFRALFASVPRRLGALRGARPAAPLELPEARAHLLLTDFARAALLAKAVGAAAPDRAAELHLRLFESGEMGEQVSMLRTLCLLPDPARFLDTGVAACRTNSLDVFEAIVCENPFLAQHFPALSFDQAVMKAIFMGVSVQRIEGLHARITPELSRMARSYASERRAAGRPVPDDATYLMSYGA